MLSKIEEIRHHFETKIAAIKNNAQLEEVRIEFLGRKGSIAAAFGLLSDVPPLEKPQFGQALNQLKKAAEARYDEIRAQFNQPEKKGPELDLTLPGRRQGLGGKHPLLAVADEIKSIFSNRKHSCSWSKRYNSCLCRSYLAGLESVRPIQLRFNVSRKVA